MKIKIFSSIFILSLLVLNLSYANSDNSEFKQYNINNYRIKIPLSWTKFDDNYMEQIDTNTELVTGIKQGNNDILIAANLFSIINGKNTTIATVRLSERAVNTGIDQSDFVNLSINELNEIADALKNENIKQNIKLNIAGSKIVSVVPLSINGKICFVTKTLTYDMNIIMYLYFLKDKNVKLTLSYKSSADFLIKNTAEYIANSLIIE